MAQLEIRFKNGLVETRQLTKDRSFTIGSAPTADFQIDQKDILDRHCVIRWADRRYRLEVDSAANNVFVGVNPITQLRLKPDAQFSITDIEFQLRYDPEEIGVTLTTDADSRPVESTKGIPLYRSPAFLGTFAGLVVLLVLAIGLYYLVLARGADKQFAIAQKELNDGLYANAIASFDRFVRDYPNDKRAEEARYLLGKSRLLEQTDTSSGSMTQAYDLALEYAKISPRLIKEHATENGSLLQKIARSLAEQAGERTDGSLLEKSRGLVNLMRSLLPEDAIHPDTMAQIESIQAEAEQSVSQGTFVNESLVRIDKAIADKNPASAYETRMAVLQRFPLLAEDKRLVDRLAQAATVEKGLVESRAVESPPANPVPPTLPAVIRYARQARDGLRPGNVLLLGCEVGESVFGVDAGTGEIRWRTPIGPFVGPAPTEVTDSFPFSVVYRSKMNDLALLDVSTGKFVSQLGLGKYRPHALCPLALVGDKLFVVLKNDDEPRVGFVAAIKTENGSLTFDQLFAFPQPVHASPAYDPRSDSLFVLAEQASMYVVSLREKSCTNVLPIGHQVEASPVAPLVVGRLLLVPRNDTETESSLNPYLIGEESGRVTPKPSVKLSASMVGSLQARQSRLFVSTTVGLSIIDIGEPTDETVLSLTAEQPDIERAQPVNENELWVVQKGKATQFSVSLTDKSLSPRGEVDLLGHPLGTEFRSGKMLVMTAWDVEQPSVQVTAIDNDTRTVAWTIRLAQFPSLGLAPGQVENMPFSDGETTWVIDAETLAKGSVEGLPLGDPRRKPVPARTWNVDPLASGLYDPTGDELVLHRPGVPAHRIKWKRPLQLSAPVRVLDQGLLLPSMDGALYWIDPGNGNERAEPFVSSVGTARARPIVAVAPIDPSDVSKGIALATADAIVKVNVTAPPSMALAEAARVSYAHQPPHQLLMGREHLWAISDDAIVALNLSQWAGPTETVNPLMSGGAIVVDDLLIGCTREGEVIAFEVDDAGKIRERWKTQLASSDIKSLLKGNGETWAVSVDGKAVAFSSADGKVNRELDFHETILGAWIVGDRLVGITPDASLISIPWKQESPTR